jgi:hypothetical protein
MTETTTVLVPKRLQTVEGADGVRRFVDPVLRSQVDSILAKAPDVTAVKLNVDLKDGNVAAVFAVQFEAGWSIAVAVAKPKGQGVGASIGIQKTFK